MGHLDTLHGEAGRAGPACALQGSECWCQQSTTRPPACVIGSNHDAVHVLVLVLLVHVVHVHVVIVVHVLAHVHVA